jgi:hypothetical protein
MTRNNISEVAYTVQTTVDALQHLILRNQIYSNSIQKHCAAILLLVAVILSFFLWLFFPTANSIYNKKNISKSLIFKFNI